MGSKPTWNEHSHSTDGEEDIQEDNVERQTHMDLSHFMMLFRKGGVNERHKKISDIGRDNIEINSHDQHGV